MDHFNINIVNENGHIHYKIVDTRNNKEIHCDINELNSTLYELMEVQTNVAWYTLQRF